MAVKILDIKEGRVTAQCSFCRGEGKDPFGLLSPISSCQVCLGSGIVTLREPVRGCAFCHGSGIHRDQRLTCLACGGRGMVHVKEPAETCPTCGGKGMPFAEFLPCLRCGGTGVVTLAGQFEEAVEEREETERYQREI